MSHAAPHPLPTPMSQPPPLPAPIRRRWWRRPLVMGGAIVVTALVVIGTTSYFWTGGSSGARTVGGVYFHPPAGGPSMRGLRVGPPAVESSRIRDFTVTNSSTWSTDSAYLLFAWSPDGKELLGPDGHVPVPYSVHDVEVIYAPLPLKPGSSDRRQLIAAGKGLLTEIQKHKRWPEPFIGYGRRTLEPPDDRVTRVLLSIPPPADPELVALARSTGLNDPGGRGRSAALVYFLSGCTDDAQLRVPDDSPELGFAVFVQAADLQQEMGVKPGDDITRGAEVLLRAQTKQTPRMLNLISRLEDNPRIQSFLLDSVKDPNAPTNFQAALWLSRKPEHRDAISNAAKAHLANPADPHHRDWLEIIRRAFPARAAAIDRALPIGAVTKTTIESGDFITAAEAGDIDLAKKLIAAKADPDICDPVHGMNSIQLAASKGDIKMLELLLEMGVSPGATSSLARLPAIEYARQRGDRRACELLGEKEFSTVRRLPLKFAYPIHQDVSANSSQEIDRLLKAGADINQRGPGHFTSEEMTPLSIAVELNRPQMVTFLLERKADPGIALGRRKLTVLHLALNLNLGEDRTKIITSLLSHGADVNAADAMGRTPLGIVQERADDGLIKLFSAAGPPGGVERP